MLNEYRLKVAEEVPYGPSLNRKTGLGHNTSALDYRSSWTIRTTCAVASTATRRGFSVDMRATFEHFDFAAVVERLQKARLLYLVTEKLTHLDLHLDVVDKAAMGTVFEELIRNVVLGNRLSGNVQAYSERKVLPHASDAWIEYDKPKVGYKIPFNRHFYVFEPPRSLADVDADLKRSADRIRAMIERMSG